MSKPIKSQADLKKRESYHKKYKTIDSQHLKEKASDNLACNSEWKPPKHKSKFNYEESQNNKKLNDYV